jgi:hypothetical protein
MEYLALYCSVILSILFLSTGFDKFFHFKKHLSSVERYGLLPEVLNIPAVVLLGVAELYIGAGLMSGIQLNLVVALGSILLAAYMWAMVQQLRKGNRIDCGCGGLIGSQVITRKSVWRNGVLISGLLSVYMLAGAGPYDILSLVPTVLASTIAVLMVVVLLKVVELKKI